MIRLLPYAEADGPTNMAADEALARTAAQGMASLRFYTWAGPTLSLGYFQTHAVRCGDATLAPLPWVRRPSGGATLVHHHELTYALALPAGSPWQSGESWLMRMHRIIAAALAELGIADSLHVVGDSSIKHGDVLCFQQFTPGDVLCAGKKVVGSAQRKYRQALVQHGSILLAQSEHTPALPGLRELAGKSLSVPILQNALERAFVADTGWQAVQEEWSDAEQCAIDELVRDKYATALWNERR